MSDQKKRKYDSTVARIAGNITTSLIQSMSRGNGETRESFYARAAESSVALARAIVAEVERTEPREGD